MGARRNLPRSDRRPSLNHVAARRRAQGSAWFHRKSLPQFVHVESDLLERDRLETGEPGEKLGIGPQPEVSRGRIDKARVTIGGPLLLRPKPQTSPFAAFHN